MNAQIQKKTYKFKTHQVETFINEVYGDQAQKIIYSNKNLYRAFKKLILERMEIVHKSALRGKELPKITADGMFTTFNNDLKHDSFFNINSFNPLKYKLPFFDPTIFRVYEIDNTDYILMIKPQPKLQN